MLEIEIFPEDVKVSTRTIPAREDKPSRIIYEQTAYAYLGGKFPVQMKLSLDEGSTPYSLGKYTVDSSSFIINNYGGLELKRFGLKVVPISPSKSSS